MRMKSWGGDNFAPPPLFIANQNLALLLHLLLIHFFQPVEPLHIIQPPPVVILFLLPQWRTKKPNLLFVLCIPKSG